MSLDAAFTLLWKIQHAFYARNVDVNDDDVLVGLAEECGLDNPAFEKYYHSTEAGSETIEDFEALRHCITRSSRTSLVLLAFSPL